VVEGSVLRVFMLCFIGTDREEVPCVEPTFVERPALAGTATIHVQRQCLERFDVLVLGIPRASIHFGDFFFDVHCGNCFFLFVQTQIFYPLCWSKRQNLDFLAVIYTASIHNDTNESCDLLLITVLQRSVYDIRCI
jgi:hypothetical protein